MNLQQVRDFWFGNDTNSQHYKFKNRLWFHANEKTDKKIANMFRELHNRISQNPIIDTPLNALSSLILLDQISRHIYRGTIKAFEYDKLSLDIALHIINNNWINDLSPIECIFVYIALLHQESVEIAKQGLEGLQKIAKCSIFEQSRKFQGIIKSSENHVDILLKFGRYPHRNEILGRQSTNEEIEFLDKYGDNTFMKSQKINKNLNPSNINNTKLKILCLHGWRQNGYVFKSKTKKLQKQLQDIATLYYVTAPKEYEALGQDLEDLVNTYDVLPDFTNQRVWWISVNDNKEYKYIDINLEYLREYFENYGPFDGIIGFAQGGTMASIMCNEGFDVQFIIPISSYYPRADRFINYKNIMNKTKSLHVYGKKDILVLPERSIELSKYFEDSKIIEHPNGHFVPDLWPYEEIKTFISQFSPYNNKSDNINWPKIIYSINEDNIDTNINLICERFTKDYAIGWNVQQRYPLVDKFKFDKPQVMEVGYCPSELSNKMIGRYNSFNRKYEISKKISNILFSQASEEKREIYLYKTIKILKRMRLEELNRYLPNPKRIIGNKTEINNNQQDLILPAAISDPIPAPVNYCSLQDLEPLIEYLENNKPVNDQIQFPKGTLTVDGRLDLCKQAVGPSGISKVLASMGKSSHVKRLLLGNNIVGDLGAIDIANEIKKSNLECWYIAGNDFTENGIVHICDSMKNNMYCTSLWLKRNPLGPSSMRPLVEMLNYNTTLQVLDLVNCGILDEGLETLLNGFNNNTLKVLWLDTNGISYKSSKVISEFIKKCQLTDISLSCNRFCDIGISEISSSLANNNTLERVSFASNRISFEGAKDLFKALENHPSITFLNLGFLKSTIAVKEYGNFIGNDGAKYLGELLKNNNKIRYIDIIHNNINQVGINYIIDGLKYNTSLIKLLYTQYKITLSETGKDYIKKKLEDNNNLMDINTQNMVESILQPWYIKDIYSVYRTKS